jgi:ribosomal-protein-alanine N-acetyltransferase
MNYKSQIELSQLQFMPATMKEYPILQNMGRFYVYDMSEFMGDDPDWQIPHDGLYECIDFKKYWQTDDTYPFLICYKEEFVGFVIVDQKGSNTDIAYNMAQFFILRKFKHKGIGRYVACECFKRFSGVWEVMVMPSNRGAFHFWHAVIKAYTHDHFTEYTRTVTHLNNSVKNIFRFDSGLVKSVGFKGIF